jgi:hypothetical protein
MTGYILLIFFTLFQLPLLGQTENIIFEQKALDFFKDSIVSKVKPFDNLMIHFNGWVDSSITTIDYSLVYLYPDDKELEKEYLKVENT